MSFGRVTALEADVVFTALTGEAKIEMGRLLAAAEDTYGGISDASLRAAVAQERYTRTLATTSEGSAAAGRATVAYRRELESISAASAQAAAAGERAAAAQRARAITAAESVGRSLTTYVAAPTLLLTGYAAKLAIGFNQQMLLIQTQAGATADEVHRLSGEVLNLAKVAPQSPEELAKGLYHLESLGLRGADAMKTLKVASIAAGEGVSDLETVTTALGGAVTSGIEGAQNYQQAMDTLIATVGAGNVRMEDLAGAIGNVAPAAAAAGISLPELGAAMAVLTDRGMSADEAATRLRMTFALLQNQSPKAVKALKDMGVDAGGLAATLRSPGGLLKVLEELHTGIETVGKTRGNKDLLQAFGGGRSGLAIQTLVNSLDSALSSYQGKLQDVTQQGLQKAVANRDAYLASPAYKLHAALSSIQADLIKFGQDAVPAIVATAKTVQLLVDAFGKLPDAAKVELGIIVGLLAVGGPVLLAITGTVKAVDTIGKAFTRVPVQAAPAIAETEAELATLRTAAAETAVSLEAVGPAAAAGAATAETELVGVGAAATGATGEVSALRLGLLGLVALAAAPIVITVIEHFIKDTGGIGSQPVPSDLGSAPPSDPNAETQGEITKKGGKYYWHRGGRYYPITAKQAAALGAPTAGAAGAHGGGGGLATEPIPGGGTTGGDLPPTTGSKPGSRGNPTAAQTLTNLDRLQLAVSNAQLALARGDRGAKEALVAALKNEIDFDRTWEARQEDLIRRHVGDAATHAKIIEKLQSDEQGALGQLASMAQDAAAAQKKAADALKTARDARLQALTQVPIDLRIAEVQLDARGGSQKKVLANLRQQKKDLEAQLAELKKMHAGKESILAVWESIDAVQQKINGITGKQDDSLSAKALSEFLSEWKAIVSQSAPNVAQGPSTFEQHLHFPTPPTDAMSEARRAQMAARAVWAGA